MGSHATCTTGSGRHWRGCACRWRPPRNLSCDQAGPSTACSARPWTGSRRRWPKVRALSPTVLRPAAFWTSSAWPPPCPALADRVRTPRPRRRGGHLSPRARHGGRCGRGGAATASRPRLSPTPCATPAHDGVPVLPELQRRRAGRAGGHRRRCRARPARPVAPPGRGRARAPCSSEPRRWVAPSGSSTSGSGTDRPLNHRPARRRRPIDDQTVLLVDDQPALPRWRPGRPDRLADPLEVVGEAPTTAGSAALKALAHRPDVVLMDLNLPDGSGVDAAREHPRHVTRRRGILVITMSVRPPTTTPSWRRCAPVPEASSSRALDAPTSSTPSPPLPPVGRSSARPSRLGWAVGSARSRRIRAGAVPRAQRTRARGPGPVGPWLRQPGIAARLVPLRQDRPQPRLDPPRLASRRPRRGRRTRPARRPGPRSRPDRTPLGPLVRWHDEREEHAGADAGGGALHLGRPGPGGGVAAGPGARAPDQHHGPQRRRRPARGARGAAGWLRRAQRGPSALLLRLRLPDHDRRPDLRELGLVASTSPRSPSATTSRSARTSSC